MSDSRPERQLPNLKDPKVFHEERRRVNAELRRVLGEISCLNRFGHKYGHFAPPPEFGHSFPTETYPTIIEEDLDEHGPDPQ